MIERFILIASLALCTANAPYPSVEPGWTARQIDQLHAWIEAAPEEGLAVPTSPEPTGQALELARAMLLGDTAAKAKEGWSIADSDAAIDLRGELVSALVRDDLDGFFAALRPRAVDYEALRLALRTEQDPGRRATLIRNMERWRWMPRDPGHRYLLVNAPGYQLSLWDNGRKIGQWRVIVGKPKTPTPVFSARVTGVTVNPWWDVPPSIVAESVGALVRRNPAEARRRGFVWGGGTYRQRPGPGNALGLVKLVMPNPYTVYLHDTPTKALFDQPVRAFSHGCVRVDRALDLAATLVGRPVDAEITRGETVTLPIAEPIPVYVAYFTAELGESGTVEFHNDIYNRDRGPRPKSGGFLNPALTRPIAAGDLNHQDMILDPRHARR
jgi:hypothetical protein